jgi:hypothetical protein
LSTVVTIALGVVLSWSAPDGCPDEAAFRKDIEALLGRSLDSAFARWVDAKVSVRREAKRFVLELSGDGSGGTFARTLEDASCEAIAEAAALIVAIAIDPSLMDPGAVDPPPPPPPPPPPAPPPPVEYVEPVESEPRSPLPFGLPWPRLGVSLFGGIDEQVRGGARFAVAIFWAYLRFEADTSYWFPRDRVSLIAAGARVCPTLPWVVELSVCGGIDLGQQRPQRAFWGAGVGAIAIAWAPIDLIALRVSGELVLSVFRPEIDRPALVGGRGIAGIEFRFF